MIQVSVNKNALTVIGAANDATVSFESLNDFTRWCEDHPFAWVQTATGSAIPVRAITVARSR